MMEGFRQFRKELSDKDDTYPQHGRFNVIIDRRDCYTKSNDTDPLIMFDPPNDCNSIPHQHLAEKYFDLSRICLIPRSGYKPWNERNGNDKAIDSTTAAQGQIMTLSYHSWASDEIKCYLYWQGQCHRFYPEDISKLLPNIFNMNKGNKGFIESDELNPLLNRMKIQDTKFENFYRKLHGLQPSSF